MTYLVDMASVATKTLKGKKLPNGDWDEDTRRSVLEMMQRGISIRQVSELSGVNSEQILLWRKQPWWTTYLDEYNREKRKELSTRLSNIVNAALSKIEDRLENGDYVLNNKTGEIVRKPVSLRDATQVAKDLLGEQTKIHKLDQNTQQFETSAKDILLGLAKEFAKFNQRLKRESATDIQFREVNDTEIEKLS